MKISEIDGEIILKLLKFGLTKPWTSIDIYKSSLTKLTHVLSKIKKTSKIKKSLEKSEESRKSKKSRKFKKTMKNQEESRKPKEIKKKSRKI